MTSLTSDCKPQLVTFWHGSSSKAGIENMLCPPEQTGIISEQGRKKNLDRVFFTTEKGYAEVYARRACNSYGGEPKLYRVVCPVDVQLLNATKGCDVWHASWAFVEDVTELMH